jgi:hypothetical protein
MVNYVVMCEGVQLKSKLQHVGAYIIAQQYSFATLVSLHVQSCQEKFRMHFKGVISFIFFIV